MDNKPGRENTLAEILYLQRDYLGAFKASLDSIQKSGCEFINTLVAIAVIKGMGEKFTCKLVDRFIESAGFGSFENAVSILPDIFEDADERYMICSNLAVIAVRLGCYELAVRSFGNCLSTQISQISTIMTNNSTIAKYEKLASTYDDTPLHTETIRSFLEFFRPCLGDISNMTVIDAPCGTGILGQQLHPFVNNLIGIDISHDMLSQAELRGCYNTLVAGDLIETLPKYTADLITSPNSLCYFSDINSVAIAAATALKVGGYFAFTDHPAPKSTMVTISGNPRYCRSSTLVRETLFSCGFIEINMKLGLCVGLPSYYWLFQKDGKS
jgi:SAM-dependent methyltransferase